MLHQLNAMESTSNLINHVRHLLKHQLTFQIGISISEAKQIMTVSTAKINDEDILPVCATESLSYRISTFVCPHGFCGGLERHQVSEPLADFGALLQIFEQGGLRCVPRPKPFCLRR